MKLLGMIILSLFLVACGKSAGDNSSAETIETGQQTQENYAHAQTDADDVSFMAVGDNLIHNQIYRNAQTSENTYNFKPIYKDVADEIQNTDLAFINQETMFGGDYRPYSAYPRFNTPSDMAGDLSDLGFDLVNGSNNHTLDMGTEGLMNTIKYWDQYKDQVLYTGVFESQAARDNIPVIEKNGMTFSLLSYTYDTNGIEPEQPYHVNYFDPELIKNDVQSAQEMSDFVIVSAHWGDEHTFQPNTKQKEYAQYFADLGVDLVVGHHPHTIQPMEWVTGTSGNETLVAYSLGNFFASSMNDINSLGGSLHLDFNKEGNKEFIDNVRWEPLVIHHEEKAPGNATSRHNFSVYELSNYTTELAQQHSLNDYGFNITPELFQNMTRQVIDPQFLK